MQQYFCEDGLKNHCRYRDKNIPLSICFSVMRLVENDEVVLVLKMALENV